MQLLIEILNPVVAKIDVSHCSYILPAISYTSTYWKQGTYKKVRKTYTKNVIISRSGNSVYLDTGLVSRIKDFCTANKMNLKVVDTSNIRYKTTSPNVDGVVYRPDQLTLIQAARQQQRGIILSPTGTGKTWLQMGIISCWPEDTTVLIMAHTLSLVTQTIKELQNHSFKKIQMVGAGNKDKLAGQIIVGTIQSMISYDPKEYGTYFDMVIIDEGHHISGNEVQYTQFLRQLMAPCRFAFTATMPQKEEAVYALEGGIGPIIGELSVNEAAELGIIARPKIKIIKIHYNYNISIGMNYSDVYNHGIVQNLERNRKIIEIAYEAQQKRQTSLILVKEIYHGQILEQLGRQHDLRIHFVHGSTEALDRERVKDELERGKIDCAIATAIWKEGINIPSLNYVINAAGGKSEIGTLQAIGRGLRKTDTKDTVTIVDFFDPSHKYLIDHFGHRISLYCDNNWL